MRRYNDKILKLYIYFHIYNPTKLKYTFENKVILVLTAFRVWNWYHLTEVENVLTIEDLRVYALKLTIDCCKLFYNEVIYKKGWKILKLIFILLFHTTNNIRY